MFFSSSSIFLHASLSCPAFPFSSIFPTRTHTEFLSEYRGKRLLHCEEKAVLFVLLLSFNLIERVKLLERRKKRERDT